MKLCLQVSHNANLKREDNLPSYESYKIITLKALDPTQAQHFFIPGTFRNNQYPKIVVLISGDLMGAD